MKTMEEKENAPAPASHLTQGSLRKAIWVMSWPLILTTLASSIVGMVDIQVAGLLGSDVQAAVGVCEQIIFMFMIFFMSLGVGTTAIVSRAYGARNIKESTYATAQSLCLSVVAGLFFAGLALLTARYMTCVYHQSPQVLHQARMALNVFALFLVPFSIMALANATFRAIGDAKTPLVVMLIITVVNILGDYLTVVGNWPVAHLGIRGIYWSAVLSDSIGAIVILFCLMRSPVKDCFRCFWPLSGKEMLRVLHIGLPSGAQKLSFAFGTFVLFFILSECQKPTQALAAWCIGMRIESLVFMPLFALSMAVSSIVGQNLGARQYTRAVQAGWHVTGIGVGLMLVLASLMFIFAPELSNLLSHDPVAAHYTVGYLRFNAVAEPFLAVNWILSGALQGAGDTRMPMWISIFASWIVRLPLAYLLAIKLSFGPQGAWAAMACSIVISGLLIAWRFQSGKWLNVKV